MPSKPPPDSRIILALRKIDEGYTSGFERAESGDYKFEVATEGLEIDPEQISHEAQTLAKNLTAAGIVEQQVDQYIREFDYGSDHLSAVKPGDLAARCQIVIDENGGVANDGDLQAAKAIAVLSNVRQTKLIKDLR